MESKILEFQEIISTFGTSTISSTMALDADGASRPPPLALDFFLFAAAASLLALSFFENLVVIYFESHLSNEDRCSSANYS